MDGNIGEASGSATGERARGSGDGPADRPHPRPFVVAATFGAGFATPISYRTSALAYSAGGERFRGFAKVGLPPNLIAGIATVPTIPWVWSLEGSAPSTPMLSMARPEGPTRPLTRQSCASQHGPRG